MDKAKKIKLITVSCALVLLFAVMAFVFGQSKTVRNETAEPVTGETGTTERAVYTIPEEYTVTKAPGLVVSYPAQTQTESRESLFTFAGSCGTDYPLTCNGQTVAVSDRGTFSAEYALTLGDNRFVFVYGDTELEYTVRYKIEVLSAVAPGSRSEVVPGTQIEILALAYKDAGVTAVIAGQSVPMQATDRNGFEQSEGTKDYKTFVGVYTVPSVGQSMSLGAISVTASYGSESATLTGGEIYVYSDLASIAVKAAEIEQNVTLGSFYDSGTHGLMTPFTDNGLGLSQMCEILKDKTETTNAAVSSDVNDIACTPFSRGTFDYVTGAVTYEDKLMYVLASGRKVYAKDARFLPAGYALPNNSVSAVQAVRNDNTTDFYLSTLWAVPVSITLAPQQYHSGYQNRPFNVSSFTAEYIDVTFYHTDGCGGAFELPAADPVSSLEWINNGDNAVTLRCRLSRAGKFTGCSVDLTEDGKFRITVKNVQKPSRTVVIDAGHGGVDPGAHAIFDGVWEQMINLAIASKTAAILESQGVNVIMTRVGNDSHPLDERMLSARQYRPDAFVSVHSDYASNPAISGTHTFYYYPWAMPLAKAIHQQMAAAYRSGIYRPGTSEYEQASRGVKFYPFQVTRVEECPAILIECGFVSNVSDCSVLLTGDCQQILATAIANGIVEYLNSLN